MYNASPFKMLCYALAGMWPSTDEDNNYYRRFQPSNEEWQIMQEMLHEAIEGNEFTRLRKMHFSWVEQKAYHFYDRLTRMRKGGWTYADTISYRKTRNVAKELYKYILEENGFNNKPLI